jgi:hypothetical protein
MVTQATRRTKTLRSHPPPGRDRAEGEEMKPASRRWTSDEITEFDRLLDAGKEAADIAVALNRTRPAIYARRQRLYRKSAREAKDKSGLGLKAKGAKP